VASASQRVQEAIEEAKRSGGRALSGETVGDTSQFEVVSDKLRDVKTFSGTLETITARGMKFDAVWVAFPGGNDKDAKHDAK
jgi:hypothetical protein